MSSDFTAQLFGTFTLVPITSIDNDSNNHREIDHTHMNDLATRIREHGLINPITLYRPPGRQRYTLLAGRHRFYAVKSLGHDTISARVYDHELSPYELRAIEMYENITRKDLTQVEKEVQIGALHELMQRINGPSTTGSGATGHRIADTARMVGRSVGSVAGALKLSTAIKDLPQLGLDKYEKTSDALRALKRFATVVNNQHVASSMAASSHAIAANYVLGDFFENALEDESFALVECDPPYGIDAPSLRRDVDRRALAADYADIDQQEYVPFAQKLCNECYRLCSPNSWCIMWFTGEWYTTMRTALQNAGFSVHPVPAIWKKAGAWGQSNAPDMVLGNAYETFFWARKGSPKLRVPGRSNSFDFALVPHQHKVHPMERPLPLITEILNTFAWPGTSVLVPFLGSGNTLVAASQLGMPCVGFDTSELHRNAFLARLAREDTKGTPTL